MTRKKAKKSTATPAKAKAKAPKSKKAPAKSASKAKAKTKVKATKKASTMDMLLVASKTKEALKGKGMNVSADALEGLNGWVHWLVDQAQRRAASNGRKTVRAHDFLSM